MHIDYFSYFFEGLAKSAEMIWAALWVHPWVGVMFVILVAAGLILPTAGRRRRRRRRV